MKSPRVGLALSWDPPTRAASVPVLLIAPVSQAGKQNPQSWSGAGRVSGSRFHLQSLNLAPCSAHWHFLDPQR